MVDERTDAPEVMVTSGKVLFTARNSEDGVEDGVNPGKLHWFVFINLYAVGTNLLDVSFA